MAFQFASRTTSNNEIMEEETTDERVAAGFRILGGKNEEDVDRPACPHGMCKLRIRWWREGSSYVCKHTCCRERWNIHSRWKREVRRRPEGCKV